MTNQQAHDMVLAWCRSSAAKLGGRVPCMRGDNEHSSVCYVYDNAYFEPKELACGCDWVEVASRLGVYGPQWEPAPVKRAEPAPHYGYRHRRYGRR